MSTASKVAAWTDNGEMVLVRSDWFALVYLHVFAINVLAVGFVHILLLGTPARFVQAPEEARPDGAQVLRLVRIFDCVIDVVLAAQLLWCARALRRKSLSLPAVSWHVIVGSGVMACAYLVGACVDYLQCHLQASGIGSECSGLRCIFTAFSLVGFAVFCSLFPRWLFVATFCAQGLYRMEWIRKLEDFLPLSVQAGVSGLVLCIFVLPLACYAHEQFLLGKQRDLKTCATKDRDLEANILRSVPDAGLQVRPAVSALATAKSFGEEHLGGDEVGVGRVREDDARAGVAAFPTEPATLCVQAQLDIPQRVKEDHARLGTGPASSETTMLSQTTPSPEQDAAEESGPRTSSLGSSCVSSPLGKRPAAKISQHKADRSANSASHRKRQRREAHRSLVAKLDLALPEWARRGGFKGAGPRSTGVWGRSFFNVICGTIAHLRDKGLDHSDKIASSPLMTLGLNYRDLIMSSSTSIALEVGVDAAGHLLVRHLSLGARDWFRGAPWPVGACLHVRDLVDVDDWNVVEQLRDSIRKAATSASSAAAMSMRQQRIRLAHFTSCEYQAEAAAAAQTRCIDVVEYVDATMTVSCFPEVFANSKDRSEAVVRATIMFNVPASWQWTSVDASGGIGQERPQTCGKWRNVLDDAPGSARKPMLEDLIGPAHEYMGVYRLNRQKSRGLTSLETWARGSLEGLDGIATFLHDPSSLMDARDQAVLQSLRARLSGTNDMHRLHQMWSCVELHSGIASTSQGDALALFYRLKLPCNLGGYESTWTPLTVHPLSPCAQPTESAPANTAIRVIPRRWRSQSGVCLPAFEVLALGAGSTGKLGVLQRVQVNKTSGGRHALLHGLFSAPSSQLVKFSLFANKVDQGDKALLDMEARIDMSSQESHEGLEQVMTDSFLHCSSMPFLFEEDQVGWMHLLLEDESDALTEASGQLKQSGSPLVHSPPSYHMRESAMDEVLPSPKGRL